MLTIVVVHPLDFRLAWDALLERRDVDVVASDFIEKDHALLLESAPSDEITSVGRDYPPKTQKLLSKSYMIPHLLSRLGVRG